jgi:hypothetical protein
MLNIERIATAAVIDTAAGVVGIKALVRGVVDPAKGKRRPQFVSFAAVIEYDVQ